MSRGARHRDRKHAPPRDAGIDPVDIRWLECGHRASGGPILSNPARWWCDGCKEFKGRGRGSRGKEER